ncbi:MAG: hypothetical protein QXM22_03355, partial [Candidatus Bathyarchaeia archaeon]
TGLVIASLTSILGLIPSSAMPHSSLRQLHSVLLNVIKKITKKKKKNLYGITFFIATPYPFLVE